MAVSRFVDGGGSADVGLDGARLRAMLTAGEFFWLDLEGPDDGDLDTLAKAFGFHALAIEDSRQWGQRAKLEEYDDFVLLVVYGCLSDELAEVHCYYSSRYLVTVHRDAAPALEEVRPQAERALRRREDPFLVLYLVVGSLVDSFAAPLEGLSDRLETIEDGLLERAGDAQMGEILGLRRRLAHFRNALAPQRDAFYRHLGDVDELPGMTAEAVRYFRDLYDRLFRLTETVDSYREHMTAMMEVSLSTASNRLGVVTKQLSLIATIFLPLTFVTGFFGQNFAWMVDRVGSWPAFVGLGIGLQLLTIGLVVLFFRRQGWF